MAKKIQLSYKEIEDRLRVLKEKSLAPEEIGFRLLYAFGKGEREIERMKEGKGIIITFDGLLIKKEFCYKSASTLELVSVLEDLKRNSNVQKAEPKVIAVCDGKTIRAFDTRQRETFEQQVDRLYCDFEFFYPLAGVERIEYIEESPADIKAAEKLAKLHDEIRAYNEFTSDSDLHDLNTFIARLLFCFFAEDTGIFEQNIFTNTIRNYTLEDGSDLGEFLNESFNIMDTEFSLRSHEIPAFILKFPFVSGGLFRQRIQIPLLSRKARTIIIECGELDWQNINPDIFGSMIQAVVNPDERASQGMHYTSVPNIMKVIQPLFLDELVEEKNKLVAQLDEQKKLLAVGGITKKLFYDKGAYIKRGCRNLLKRMSRMKFFDPACGSGNFLIITYKQLRLLEMDILAIIRDSQPDGLLDFDILQGTVISIKQFYGIELLDFPHEIAMLSIWLAEHQMNRKLFEDFGVNTQALPLKDITQIRCGNACRIDWNTVCPHSPEEEVFILGNPPYLGGKLQSKEQKADHEFVLGQLESFKNLDYISNWFYKAAQYNQGTLSKSAFVSTNSISQGEQVGMLWPYIFELNNTICFAYSSFKWSNNAKNQAAVICVIIGLTDKTNKFRKRLYCGSEYIETGIISPYLYPGSEAVVKSTNQPISDFPIMEYGNMPLEGGFLKLDAQEKNDLIQEDNRCLKYIRRTIGGEELINSIERYCIWIDDTEREDAENIPLLKERIDNVLKFRQNGGDVARSLVNRPHQFRYRKIAKFHQILVPCTSSENRQYLQCGFTDNTFITMNSVEVIYDGDLWLFGVISSAMHMLWTKTIGGRLKNDYRYSAQLCYNTFPFPKISDEKKAEIEEAATEVLVAREPYLTMGKTLADLYDPDTMPEDLMSAHERLDDIVESCYPGYPFATDEARLECLFKMYEKMTAKK